MADSAAACVGILGLGWFPDQAGGLNRYVSDLVRGLGDGVDAVVIGPAADAPPGVNAVSRHDATLPRRLLAYGAAARRLAARVDVLDAHFALYAVAPLLLDPAARRRPLVVHFHGPWADEARALADAGGRQADLAYAVRRAIERAVYRRADRVVVLSEHFADTVVRHARVPATRVEVVPPPVDLDRFSPGDRADAREQLGLPVDAWIAVAARRLVPRTGVDLLLRAWSAVGSDPDAGPALLVVAGDGPERATLEAAALTGGGRVRFLGNVTDDELVAAYRAADVSVVPSRALEGFGLVVAESLACGTPVVVTDVGGLPEAVAGLGDDLVVPRDDAAALASRLRDARSGVRPLPTSAACRRFAGAFSRDRAIERHRALYAAVADPAPRLRIMFVDHTAKLSGGEIAMLRLCRELQQAPGPAGADITVVLFEDGPLADALRDAGIAVDVVPLTESVNTMSRERVVPGGVPLSAMMSASAFVPRLARTIARTRPDVVHANSLKAGVLGGLAARAARVPFVWHVRDRIASDYLPAPAVRALRWWIPRISDAVLTNSDATRVALGRGGAGAVVVPSLYRAPSIRRARDGGPLRVGIVGRLAPWKGQHVFLEAFADALGDGDADGVVVGAPLFGETDYAALLTDLVARLGLAERVELTGFVDDVPALLGTLDVLVHASVLAEPHGQVIVEGMAAGLAVVATDAGGPADLVTDEVDGLLVPPGDVDALAAALRRLAADAELRATLGVAAQRRARAFEPDHVLPGLVDVYRGVVRRR